MIRRPHRRKENQCVMNRQQSTSISGKPQPREPQGGGERTECAALFCINTSGNRFSARHRCPAMPLKDHDAREHIAARAEAGPHDVS